MKTAPLRATSTISGDRETLVLESGFDDLAELLADESMEEQRNRLLNAVLLVLETADKAISERRGVSPHYLRSVLGEAVTWVRKCNEPVPGVDDSAPPF